MNWYLYSQLRFPIWLLLAAILVLGVANAQTRISGPLPIVPPSLEASRPSGNSLPGPNSDSIISPDDVLDIYILDVPELSRQYRVSPSGTVQMPLLAHALPAAGMKLTAFSDAVAQALRESEVVSNPHITVSISSSRMNSVAIMGSVKMPQIYPVFGRTTLLDVLSQAQGLTDDASRIAVISRGELGAQTVKATEKIETVDLTKLLESGNPADNVDIYPGDRVTVPRAGIVYVTGAVTKPGGFVIKSTGEGMTVLQALALAENVKSTAIRSKAVVIRADPSAPNGRRQIPMDLKKILAGKMEDPVLQGNDILFVPDSTGKKAFSRSIDAAVAVTTGIIIYGHGF
jgi:polysaccharide export outer membrane protein